MSVRLGYFGSLLFFPFPFPLPFFFLDPRSTPRAPSMSACNSGSCQSFNSSTKPWFHRINICIDVHVLYRGETTFASIKIILYLLIKMQKRKKKKELDRTTWILVQNCPIFKFYFFFIFQEMNWHMVLCYMYELPSNCSWVLVDAIFCWPGSDGMPYSSLPMIFPWKGHCRFTRDSHVTNKLLQNFNMALVMHTR